MVTFHLRQLLVLSGPVIEVNRPIQYFEPKMEGGHDNEVGVSSRH